MRLQLDLCLRRGKRKKLPSRLEQQHTIRHEQKTPYAYRQVRLRRRLFGLLRRRGNIPSYENCLFDHVASTCLPRLKNRKMIGGAYEDSLKQRCRQHSVDLHTRNVFASRSGGHERNLAQGLQPYPNILWRQNSISVDDSISSLAAEACAREHR